MYFEYLFVYCKYECFHMYVYCVLYLLYSIY